MTKGLWCSNLVIHIGSSELTCKVPVKVNGAKLVSPSVNLEGVRLVRNGVGATHIDSLASVMALMAREVREGCWP